jgi:hypothetical protein
MTYLAGNSQSPIRARTLKGLYYFESGLLTVLAAAHAATGGFFWLINPVGSTVIGRVKKLDAYSAPTAATAFTTSPRVRVERVTFTGTASGATIAPAKRDSTDAAATLSLRTASTGLVLTADNPVDSFCIQCVVTAAGIAMPQQMSIYQAQRDEDDGIILRAGEGLVFRQADAGSASDTRFIVVSGTWEEQ